MSSTIAARPLHRAPVRGRSLALALTFGRVPLGLAMLTAMFASRSLAAALVVAFVLLDIADGMVARSHGVDDDARRVADGLIDRAFSCPPMIMAAVMFAPWAVIPAAGVFVRETAIGVGNLRALGRYGVVYSASAVHKLTSVGYAVAGIALLVSSPFVASIVTAIAFLFSLLMTPLYIAQRRSSFR